MKIILYFSPTHSSKQIADHVSDYLNIPSINITSYKNRNEFDYSIFYELIIMCFPVYSENIPNIVTEVIKKLKSKSIVFLITYGRMGMGNTLYEAKKLTRSVVIAGAYIPTKHSYKKGEYFKDIDKLSCLLEKVKCNSLIEVDFPKLKKNIFANFIPNYRSRIGVRLKRTKFCINCGICNNVCPTRSINNGTINNKSCIRCLSCHFHCPNNGLNIKYSKLLKFYLKKDKSNQLLLFY